MAQTKFYKPVGALRTIKDYEYTANNIPSVCDTVQMLLGVRITDTNGNPTPLRGARVVIKPVGITLATTPVPSVPFIWLENEFLVFDADFTYTFIDECTVGYGIEVII